MFNLYVGQLVKESKDLYDEDDSRFTMVVCETNHEPEYKIKTIWWDNINGLSYKTYDNENYLEEFSSLPNLDVCTLKVGGKIQLKSGSDQLEILDLYMNLNKEKSKDCTQLRYIKIYEKLNKEILTLSFKIFKE